MTQEVTRQVEIVVGEAAHIEAIARFQVAMALESEGTALDPEVVHRGVSAAMADKNRGTYLVALRDGEPLGSLMLTREWSDWHNRWYWWIQSVYVVPEHRRQGIYKALYEQVLKLANAEGITQVRLYVDKQNHTAQRVYQRLGMAESTYAMYELEA